MRLIGAFPILAAAVGLAACSIPEQTVNTTQPTVSVQYRAGDGEAATAEAGNYCARQYSARAEAISRTLTDDTYKATFLCVR